MGPRSALQWFDYERLRTALLWTNVALFAMHRAEFRRCETSRRARSSDPALPAVALRRVMVALKSRRSRAVGDEAEAPPVSLRYAMLTASEAKRFFTCEDARTAMQWLMDMQLVTMAARAHDRLRARAAGRRGKARLRAPRRVQFVYEPARPPNGATATDVVETWRMVASDRMTSDDLMTEDKDAIADARRECRCASVGAPEDVAVAISLEDLAISLMRLASRSAVVIPRRACQLLSVLAASRPSRCACTSTGGGRRSAIRPSSASPSSRRATSPSSCSA